MLLALFGLVASLTALSAAAEQRADQLPGGLEYSDPPIKVVPIPPPALSATLEAKCVSASEGQAVSVVTNHSQVSQKAWLAWDSPTEPKYSHADYVAPGASGTLWKNFPDGTTFVFTTTDDNGNVLAQIEHTFDCRPKRAQPFPHAGAEIVCTHPGAGELVVKLSNTGSAPAAFDVSVVTANKAPVPQPGTSLVSSGGSHELRIDVEHDGVYEVDIRLKGETSPRFTESYTVDCPDPHDPNPKDPDPEDPEPPGGGGNEPKFTG